MALHPLAERFASVADAYERGRPDYRPAVVGAIAAELGLDRGSRVLDLGAGTGKLSVALLAAGLDVLAVEPQASLREVLSAKIGADRVRDGLAEAIPLEDASVPAVTVADAFHWFDHRPAVSEIARVLSPGGGLAVISTVPDWSGASWAHDLGTLVAGSRPEHPAFDGPPWQDAVRAAGGWSEPREIRLSYSQPASRDRIVDHLTSISWIAAMPDKERTAVARRMRAIVEAGETPPELPLHVVIGLAIRA
jgi:SAM-dependent methyltransferase